MDNRDGTLSLFGTMLDAAAPSRRPRPGPAAGFTTPSSAPLSRVLTFNDPQREGRRVRGRRRQARAPGGPQRRATGEGSALMKVAVLGSGNGGCAVAFDWAQHGHEVSLFAPPRVPPRTWRRWRPRAGSPRAPVHLEGFAPIRYAGARHRAEAHGRRRAGRRWSARRTPPSRSRQAAAAAPAPRAWPSLDLPRLVRGQRSPSSARPGSRSTTTRYVVGETSTLPYAVRVTEPGHDATSSSSSTTGLFARGACRAAATERLLRRSVRRSTRRSTEAESVFQTTLQNGNPVIHPAVTLLNAALLERTGGGVPLLRGGRDRERRAARSRRVDRERLAIAAALGVTILSEPEMGVRQGYMVEENYSTGYSAGAGLPRDPRPEQARPPLPDRGRRLLAGLPGRPRRADSACPHR